VVGKNEVETFLNIPLIYYKFSIDAAYLLIGKLALKLRQPRNSYYEVYIGATVKQFIFIFDNNVFLCFFNLNLLPYDEF
jgi:hypothetical protein